MAHPPPRRTRAFRTLLALASLAMPLLLGGCDWIQFAFMNSIPFKGNPKRNPEVHIYLGVDGLSYYTAKDAMARGAFAAPDWRISKLVTMFPGTSDASWTRTLHAEKLGGYEIEYYDPAGDAVRNSGIQGLAQHIMPNFGEFLNFEHEYLKAFDYRANGYLHAAEAYGDTFLSKANTFDNLFITLEGRVQTAKAFSAYLLEFDVMGHMRSSVDVGQALKELSKRIEKFRANHPERVIHFTLLSDHGMDFKAVPKENLIAIADELPKIGVKAVRALREHDPAGPLVAIPIMHTRVTYIALHTPERQAEEIARRVTQLPSVDLTVSRSAAPVAPAGQAALPETSDPLQWFAIWADGRLALRFAFSAQSDEYYLPAGQDYARLDVPLADEKDFQEPDGQGGTRRLAYRKTGDDELFALLKHRKYPDLFYRARTSMSAVGIEHPAEVMVSFRLGYASKGFTIPGKDDIASAGFHGAMDDLSSLGTLLTTERELPDAVRSDTLMEMFPKMREHIRSLGVGFVEGDPNAALRY